jgi:hypothetical protein
LDQALNAKEFAVAAGISYSTAREWFRLPSFPVFRGVIFWQDFVRWRTDQNGFHSEKFPHRNGDTATTHQACLRAPRKFFNKPEFPGLTDRFPILPQ